LTPLADVIGALLARLLLVGLAADRQDTLLVLDIDIVRVHTGQARAQRVAVLRLLDVDSWSKAAALGRATAVAARPEHRLLDQSIHRIAKAERLTEGIPSHHHGLTSSGHFRVSTLNQ